MRLLLLTALLLLIVTPHSLYANEAGKQKEFIGPPNCPPNYYGDRTTTRCFGFPKKDPKDAKTWVEAEKACREQGGLLAILSGNGDGAKVLQYLRSEAIKHGVHGAWVAANDGPTKNNFAWLDDSPVTPSGLLKYHAKYPEEHEGPSCIWLSFEPKQQDIYIRNQHCNKEKHQYICHMPLYLKEEDTYTTQKPHITPAPDKKNILTPPKVVEPPPLKGKAVSITEIKKTMPENLPGASAILSVSADKLIQARSDVIVDMYGSGLITDEEMEKLVPPELLTANISDASITAVRAELTEIVGDYFQRHRRSNATEIAKYVTSQLLEEGRSIRCIFGVNQQQRQVECLPANGIIDSCAKTITMDGTVARECGLPGLKQLGCHNTMRGVSCFCENDLCNNSNRPLPPSKSLLLTVLISIIFRSLI